MSALISDRELVTLESSNGRWRADVHPVGASLVALWFDDAEIAVTPYSENFYAFAGATLAPWPNRLEDGTWVFEDQARKHRINDERGHNANHGLVFDRKFVTSHSTADSITFERELGGDEVFPFMAMVKVHYLLTENGFTQTISLKNRSHLIIPAAFGSHPYFLLEQDSQVQINAREVFTNSSRGLPIERVALDSSGIAKQGFNSAAELEVDDCFTALIENADSKYSTLITRPGINGTVEIWQDCDFEFVMLFAFHERGENGRMCLAVEPQTSPANSLRSGDHLIWLAPDETTSASWGVKIRNGISNG